ncbi:MAG: hypothetical protein ABSA59_15860, partial [Terriglobia bacterium]
MGSKLTKNAQKKARGRASAPAHPEKTVSLGRHEFACKICAHPDREEIERDFVGWKSPITIAIDYALADRASVYRHAHALGLFA